MNQELRQAAAQAKEALLGVVRVFPTDTDMAEANWPTADINSACDAYDAARAALSALSAVLEKQDSSHLPACDSAARSGSGVPARPTSPGELHAAIMNLPCFSGSVSTQFTAGYHEGHRDARHAAAELALAASPLPQARMLTDEEMGDVVERSDGAEHSDDEFAHAAIRKFCEVNGIAIAGTQGEQKP